MNITILGAGAWGTALAIFLAERHPVVLWGRHAAAMQEAAAQRENTAYLPGFPLPPAVQVTADFDFALAHIAKPDALLLAAPAVAGLRPLLQRLATCSIPDVVWLCKGFEADSGLLPHQIAQELLGPQMAIGALSGPSFAQEVAQGLPCALTIASRDVGLCYRVVTAFHTRSMRVYSTDDVTGVEVGGAVKNILAIAAGMTDGLGLGFNARAALLTRGLAEITRLGVALGGRSETFMGLIGMGDLILTCTGDLSRNRRVGLELAQGKTLPTIVAELGHVAEGVRCVQAVVGLAQKHQVEMPIVNAVARVLFDGESPQDMVKQLLSREPRREVN